ncbi:MAG: hypothetical protein LC781_22570 [Actinobacteria bacterium]|nr:hypothetical protein [Actinomycetota bacterium]
MYKGNGSRATPGELLRLVLPTIGLLLAVLLPQQEVYAGTGYGLSLLAALSAVGCAGYLANHALRHHEPLLAACSILAGLLSVALVFDGTALVEYGGWSEPVVSMLISFFVLFSGLGGWVEAREPRLTTQLIA